MTTPSLEEVQDYLSFNSCGNDTGWTDDQLWSTLVAETAAQAAVCRVPDPMPADLAEALYRRVAYNLQLQALTANGLTEIVESVLATTNAGGLDPMVRRLEAPYRKCVVG